MDKRYLEGCLSKGMSLKQIARDSDRAPGTVGYWIRKHGLRALGSDKYDPNRRLSAEQLSPLLDEGLSLSQIAAQTGRSVSAVHSALVRFGLGPTGPMRRTQLIRGARMAGQTEIELECSKHGTTEFWIGRTSVRCRRCNAEGVVDRRRKVKGILVREAGGSCRICGYDRSQVALEFHHLDPAAKEFGLSHSGISRSLSASRREAAKCILLCANCHAEVEAGITRVPDTR